MAVLVVNAQVTKTTVTKEKSARTTVKVADLQKAITDNIAKDYAGYTIKEASFVTSNNTFTYEVVIVQGNNTETHVNDKFCFTNTLILFSLFIIMIKGSLTSFS